MLLFCSVCCSEVQSWRIWAKLILFHHFIFILLDFIWIQLFSTEDNWAQLLFLALILPGCGHPLSRQPRVEELHPGLHVQRLWPGADGRKLLQAKPTHCFYVFRRLCFQRQRSGADNSAHILHICICIWSQNWMDLTARWGIYSVKRGKNLWMMQLSHFVQTFALGQASIMQLNIVFPQLRMQMRECVAINLEWVISIISLRYPCGFSSASFSVITTAFIIWLLIARNWASCAALITFPNRAMLLQPAF